MKNAIKFFQTLLIALAISLTLLSIPGMTSPAAASDCQPLPHGPRTNGIVTRLHVEDLQQSKSFYEVVLGMVCIENFDRPDWAELYNYVDPRASIGLDPNGGPLPVTTKIVPDLAWACEDLDERGIRITKSEYAGSGVCLAFFDDPTSKNKLGYRQEKWPIDVDPEVECNNIVANQCSL